MFIKAEDMEVELRKQMRGGSGTVKMIHICKNDLPEKSRLLAHMVLEKGTSIGYHDHNGETEIFYFLKGQGKVDDNGKVCYVKAGDAISTSNGNGHSVTNIGEDNLEFVAVIILD